jgi:hypothetical protein
MSGDDVQIAEGDGIRVATLRPAILLPRFSESPTKVRRVWKYSSKGVGLRKEGCRNSVGLKSTKNRMNYIYIKFEPF